jgi:hypothetical protein
MAMISAGEVLLRLVRCPCVHVGLCFPLLCSQYGVVISCRDLLYLLVLFSYMCPAASQSKFSEAAALMQSVASGPYFPTPHMLAGKALAVRAVALTLAGDRYIWVHVPACARRYSCLPLLLT